MATNPLEEEEAPDFGDRVAEVLARTGDGIRAQAILVAFVAGQLIGFILGRI